jgi:hypothetical protein
MALGGVIVALAGTIVAVVKQGWMQTQALHNERLADQRAHAEKSEELLSKILPLAEGLTSVAEDFLKKLEELENE